MKVDLNLFIIFDAIYCEGKVSTPIRSMQSSSSQ